MQRLASIALTLVLAASCGARTGLNLLDAGPPCRTDDDCDDGIVCDGHETCNEGRCHRGVPLACDDMNECTDDACEEPTGCTHVSLQHDIDMDTYKGADDVAPLSCVIDCDDHNPAVHPGATEVCNGIDDDCDDRIDEGAAYMPSGDDVRLTMDDAATSAGSVAWDPNDRTWGTTYWDYATGSSDIHFLELAENGRPNALPKLLTPDPADAFGGRLVWADDRYAILWEDRRDGNFELYFNLLTPDGDKLGSDIRLTDAPGFSINASIALASDRYVVAWQDARNENASAPDNFEIYMTLVDRDGVELGDDQQLTDDPAPSESPSIAIGPNEVGVAFLDSRTGSEQVWFFTTDLDLHRTSDDVRLSLEAMHADAPSTAWTERGFVVAWESFGIAGDPDIETSLIAPGPTHEVTGPIAVVSGPSWSRGPSVLSNGDRVLVVYSDDRAGTFDLFLTLFDTHLTPIGMTLPVTTAPGDSISRDLARGFTSVGVIFKDQRDGNWEAYFTRLLCSSP